MVWDAMKYVTQHMNFTYRGYIICYKKNNKNCIKFIQLYEWVLQTVIWAISKNKSYLYIHTKDILSSNNIQSVIPTTKATIRRLISGNLSWLPYFPEYWTVNIVKTDTWI